MSKHTPGPWTIREPGYIEAKSHSGQTVALLGYAYNLELAPVCKKDEVKANALLIAAAPDLLSACEALVDGSCDAYQHAVVAIAKAKGGAA